MGHVVGPEDVQEQLTGVRRDAHMVLREGVAQHLQHHVVMDPAQDEQTDAGRECAASQLVCGFPGRLIAAGRKRRRTAR